MNQRSKGDFPSAGPGAGRGIRQSGPAFLASEAGSYNHRQRPSMWMAGFHELSRVVLAACRTQVLVFVRADNIVTDGDGRGFMMVCP